MTYKSIPWTWKLHIASTYCVHIGSSRYINISRYTYECESLPIFFGLINTLTLTNIKHTNINQQQRGSH